MHSPKGIHTTFPKKTIKTFLRLAFSIVFFISLLFFSKQDNVEAVDLSIFLCEVGIKYYKDGDYLDALHEFQKALMINPDNEIAKEYIQTIKKGLGLETEPVYQPQVILPRKERRDIISKTLNRFEEMFKDLTIPIEAQPLTVESLEMIAESAVYPEEIPISPEEIIPPKKAPTPSETEEIAPKMLSLDETTKATQPQTRLELQIGRNLIIQGENIARFLVINPEMMQIKKKGPDEILVIPKKIGSTYFHVWDKEGRWTFIAQISPFRSGRPTLAELYRRQLEEAESFKLYYSNDWYTFNTGRRVDDLERQSLSFYQNLGFEGQTPYGDLDGRVKFNKLKKETKITYYTLGLEDGMVGPFKGFDVRAFDYSVDFANLGFGGASLRGVKLDSEAFQDTVNYTVFWGKENQGIFSPLSPGLAGSKESFLEGFRLGISPPESDTYQTVSYVRGYGSARDPTYSKDSYDYTSQINFGDTRLRSDVGFDGQTLVYLFNSNYTISNFQLTSEFRNIEDEFVGVTGRPYASGELGALFNCRYNPTSKVTISSRLDTYRDRLFPNPEDEDLYNIDFTSGLNYVFDPTASLRIDYYNTHDTGTISPHKDESIGLSFYKTLDFIKKLNTYINFRHQTTKNPTSPTLDYKSEKMSFGLRFGLTDNLYYFVSKEYNWTEEYTGDMYRPHAFDTGLDYNTQFFDTPFYVTSRLYFRDEEDATGTRSFLAGQDNLEAQGELRYEPSEDFSAYVNLRLNNIWAENPDVSKRMEAEVRLGTRWTFDTHFRWNPIGSIAGIVFKDLNSDGVYQSDEPAMNDIKILLGEEKYDMTDAEGMYLFKNIRAKKIFLSIDTDTLPPGFVLTGSPMQEITIEHRRIVNVDFGIIARSEIYGVVFNDVNGDGKFDSGDVGIGEAVLTLEDGSKATTNDRGQYYLRGASPGEHTITLDINSLPVNLIPRIPVFKKIELFEGMTYIHNIPLKEVKK